MDFFSKPFDSNLLIQQFWVSFCFPRNSKFFWRFFEGKGTGGPHHCLQAAFFRLLNQLFPIHSLVSSPENGCDSLRTSFESIQRMFCRQMHALFSSQGLSNLNGFALDQIWVTCYYSLRSDSLYMIIHHNFTLAPCYANSKMVFGLKHGKGTHLSKKGHKKFSK